MQLPSRPRPKDRTLTDHELKAIWNAADEYGYPFGTIVKLLTLTGQRRAEIASLRWAYINMDERLITLPPDLTKNRRRHRLPFGSVTAAVLEDLPQIGDLVFPARGHKDRAYSGFSKGMESLRSTSGIEGWSLHDLRRTFATNLAALGTPIQVTEKLLNHVSGSLSGVVAIYNRHTYLDEMREAVRVWEAKLKRIVE